MNNFIKSVANVAISNWPKLLWFEIPYKIIGFYYIYPCIKWFFKCAVSLAGLTYISQENIFKLFMSPYFYPLAFCAFLLFSFYVYYEITALILYCDWSWRHERFSVLKLWKVTLKKSVRIFHYKNLPTFILILPLLGLSNFFVLGDELRKFKIPEFIIEFVVENPMYTAGFLLGILLINYALLKNIFIIPHAILNDCTFLDSRKPNLEMLKSRKTKTAVTLLTSTAIYFILSSIVWVIFVFIIYLDCNLSYSGVSRVYAFKLLYTKMNISALIFSNSIFIALFAAVVIILYHSYQQENYQFAKEKTKGSEVIKKTLSILIAAVMLMMFSETEIGSRFSVPEDTSILIIAHRAGAYGAPENTLAALNIAIESGADMAEIDVQQTKDKELIVMHDSNFKRITGMNKNVWDADYNEVSKLDAGKYYSMAFEGEKIPKLEEMLDSAKNKIDLMIELKSTGHETDLERKTVDLIEKYGMEKQCVIASMNMDILRKAKEYNTSIETVYITTLLLTDDYSNRYIDGYSVETTFLSSEMVHEAHFTNKKVFTWTANSEDTIKKIILCGADGIITDSPSIVYSFIESKDSTLDFWIDLFYGKE